MADNRPPPNSQQTNAPEKKMDGLVEILQRQAKPLLGLVILIFAGLAVWQGQQYYENQQELKAQEQIGARLFALDQKVQAKLEKSSEKKEGDEVKQDEDDTAKVDLKSDLLPLASELRGAIEQNLNRQVAQLATIQLADFYLENDMAQEAKTVIDLALQKSGKGTWVRQMLQIQLSTSLIELGDHQEALSVLNSIDLSQSTQKYLKGPLGLRKALLQERLGKVDLAQSDLVKLSLEDGSEASAKRASQLLRLQQLKSNLKDQGDEAQRRAN